MSSPRGSVREGTRIVLKEITATLHNSSPIHPSRRKSGNDTPLTLPKTAEHEVKVHFAREFADVGSVTENLCLAPESLSSASSFHSLSSTLSIKSSSGICTDSTPETPDNVVDTSYVNSNIPGVEDLILACADIHLGSEYDSQDLSQDQTFTSAIDEVPFSTRDCSLNEDLLDNADNGTQVIEISPQLCKTTPLNQTHILGSSNNTLPVQDSQFVTSYPPAEEYVLQVEESIDKHIPLQESATVTEIETFNIVSNLIKDSLPTSNVNDNQLNITTTVSSNNITFDVITLNEEQTVKNDCNAEISLEDPQSCPTEISVPSTSPLTQYADLSLPSISNISSPLEHTDSSTTKETSIQTLSEFKQDTLTVLSPSDNLDQKLCVSSQVIVNNSITQTETNEIIKEQELSELDNDIEADKEENILLPNNTSIIEPKTLEVEENLQTSIDKKDLEVENSVVLNEVQKLSEEGIAICNETHVIEKQNNSSETVIIEKEKCIVENAPTTSDIKKDISSEILDRTLTLQEIDINFASDEEQYEKFKPQRQSTTLSLINGHFEELKSTVEKVTNELLNPSLEFTEETDQFVSATPEFFQDPSTFDFLLARSNPTNHTNRFRTESLYVKFDPLVSNISMLPQGNAQTINEEKNGKNESPLPDVGTPKRNPAIAAIDRLLFYSPLPNATVQKSEEVQEKNEQPIEEPKSDAPLIDHIDMSKELELVRTTVLQLEEELEKQKKEHEAELERQKATFQEKINKLQAQMSQEIKTKTQMTVVVEEYEKSISRLLTERERDRTSFEQDKIKLQEELQAANHHLTNTEAAFNDVHQKYERLKGVVSVYKNNETVLKESIQENVETIKTLETRYDQLKEHAMAQLEKANLELDGIRKQNEAETVKLHAMIRKAELKSNSLAELVEQKSKENKELAKILDEVIARVGHGNSE
ncbi:PREDICTED: transforming acidic coiled-coil-containing protein 3 isoform X1 [Atta colombica]|uniref:transforming acidic coiled-coil-containing protein 3 isoform X1 n=1 Tax=Atta colombica TaxID=520822 RepID=UPI00084C32A8|nr:PREDICTED: transforming acidic coiled-coil-containing protein 3 isoform X1 [Atta colombica]